MWTKICLWYLFRKSKGQFNIASINLIMDDNGVLISEYVVIINECKKYNIQLLNSPEYVEEYDEFYHFVDEEVERIKRSLDISNNAQE